MNKSVERLSRNHKFEDPAYFTVTKSSLIDSFNRSNTSVRKIPGLPSILEQSSISPKISIKNKKIIKPQSKTSQSQN